MIARTSFTDAKLEPNAYLPQALIVDTASVASSHALSSLVPRPLSSFLSLAVLNLTASDAKLGGALERG